ncbi:MAG: CBS domain-containing protein [Blastocatellia bacterium]
MLRVSALSHWLLTDAHSQEARLHDLGIDLFAEEYPSVQFILWHNDKKQLMALRWNDVQQVDYAQRRLAVQDLSAAAVAAPDWLARQTLLRRDVLDSLLLDLENRRAARANELWLAATDDPRPRLVLQAADASWQAVFRRLTRGWFAPGTRPALLLDWKYVEFLQGDPEAAKDGAGAHLRVARMPPGEIARLLEALPYLHAAELLKLLPDALAADVLEMMTAERELQVFEELGEEQAARLLMLMAPDAAADLLGRLHTETAQHHLEQLPAEKSERVIELLRYPEDSVGGVMTNDVLFVPASLTVREAREALRERLRATDFAYFIYVVDDEDNRQLQGMIMLRELLTADDQCRLSDVMKPYVTTLNPLTPARAAADLLLSSHLAALPVLGQEGRLLGVMTVDAAVAQAAPQSWSAQAPRVFS